MFRVALDKKKFTDVNKKKCIDKNILQSLSSDHVLSIMNTKQISTSEEPSPLLPSRRAPFLILYPTNHEQRQSQYHHYHSHFNNAKLNSSSSSNEPPPTPLQRRFSVISVHHALAARAE
eukprot:GEMP01131977.1.p1 GENE.GEMP01131977.1~~GEMP01131977.1.p1  ORF type:complete len:119 (-),score=9.24 GEMP01131977.1:114-470(-)